jgi:hypothetical protein
MARSEQPRLQDSGVSAVQMIPSRVFSPSRVCPASCHAFKSNGINSVQRVTGYFLYKDHRPQMSLFGRLQVWGLYRENSRDNA